MQSQKNLTIKIGTRGSPLALYQAQLVQRLLGEAHGIAEDDHPCQLPIHVIKTTGDKVQDRALSAIGGKGLFTKEIEEALLDGSVDVAVHSLKDMPTEPPEGLVLTAALEREDPRDAFLSPKAASIEDLPNGSIVGSTSLRRQAQILAKRPDLKVITYRGTVETRLKKLADGDVDATLLAVAGLNRLGKADVITSIIDPGFMVSAVGQGAITVEARIGDKKTREALKPLSHIPTELAVATERAFLAVLDGSCRTPIAGYAHFKEADSLVFVGRLLMPDGTGAKDVSGTAKVITVQEAIAFGTKMGETLKAEAGADFMARLSLAVEKAGADPGQAPAN
jgi:hydroxymethylbilane synthase